MYNNVVEFEKQANLKVGMVWPMHEHWIQIKCIYIAQNHNHITMCL